jgi:hypothetical protein
MVTENPEGKIEREKRDGGPEKTAWLVREQGEGNKQKKRTRWVDLSGVGKIWILTRKEVVSGAQVIRIVLKIRLV